LEDVVYYNDLYDLYGELLTSKQRQYFEDYYFNNFTLSEMAENYGVSRNAISRQLHFTIDKLNELEEILKIYEKRSKLLVLVKSIDDEQLKEEIENLF